MAADARRRADARCARRIDAAVGPYSAYPRSSVVEGGQVLRLLPGPYRLRALRRGPAGRGAEQGRHLAVPGRGPSDRHRRDREHARPRRARSRARPRRDAPPQPRAPRGAALHARSTRQRLRQRQLSGRARAAARRRPTYDRLRREQAAARAARAPPRHRTRVLRRADRARGRSSTASGGAPISGQEGTTVRLEPVGRRDGAGRRHQPGAGHATRRSRRSSPTSSACRSTRVAVLSGDTAMVPYGGGTWASRGMPIGGSATLLAARALGERIRTIAGDAAGGARRRHRARRRPRGRARQPRARPGLRRAGAGRALPVQRAARRRAEPRGDRALHESRRRGPSPTARTWPSSRSTSRRAGCGCCATSPSTTAGGSSTPRSSRARSPAASPRGSAARSASTASTTTRASSSRRP